MAKIFIEETTLTSIGDAIRSKTGKTELIDPLNMGAEIEGIVGGSDPVIEELSITSNGTYNAPEGIDGYSPITVNVPQDGTPSAEAFVLTGDCSYRFIYGGWDWFIEQYGNRITTTDISKATNMFNGLTVEEIPFQINLKTTHPLLASMFLGALRLRVCPKIRGNPDWAKAAADASDILKNCTNLRDVEDLFTPEMLESFSTFKCTGAYSIPRLATFYGCHSLRKVPTWWYKFKLNPESTAFPASSYTPYYSSFYNCFVLDEIRDIPVWDCQAAQTSNMFSSTFNHCSRAKSITFETNSDGSPIEVKWKAQLIDLTAGVGYINTHSGNVTNYNSGITADKQVTDDATYQALKNDPDWYSLTSAYSHYNHNSAVETINSLPDTSAYLATAGGTNTIKFKKVAGSSTDGGAIETLTEEEIAVATAKGWTVTLV